MNSNKNQFFGTTSDSRHTKVVRDGRRVLLLILTISALLIFGALWLRKCTEDATLFGVELYSSKAIDLTPTQIRSIERIGKWEFLAIADEELVDSIRERTLARDDRLVRIYHGTLRLGIDLSQCHEGWLQTRGDTVSLLLPPISLLSEHFIDEARTRSFYESGTWDARAKEQMYQKATRQMKRRSLSPDNLRQAEDNARNQFSSLFRSFGFSHTEIQFEKR